MPFYTYRCKNEECKIEFFIPQRISEAPLTDCVMCHQKNVLERIIGDVTAQYVGRGFPSNDFKKDK